MKILSILNIVLIFFITLLYSCSNIQSGKYVRIRKGESINDLARSFRIPPWPIISNNKGQKFKEGDWVFVPLPRGILRGSYSQVLNFLNGRSFIWPVPSSKQVSSTFGRRWGKKHEGIDIPAKIGAAILSIDNGKVVYSGNGLAGYGNLTIISHDFGFYSIYAHAKRNLTQEGDRVLKGQTIAEVGISGKSTGAHLHLEIRHEGKAIDPSQIISLR